MRIVAALVAGLLLAAAACSDDHDAEPSPTTTQATTSTTVVDRSGIALAGVAGSTTSTVVERGSARITGVVQGPGGPVPGATVRIERLVADRVIRNDVLTGADGSFLLEGVPGGRYRVRAFLAPTLAQLVPEVRFLTDEADHDFQLVVETQSGLAVRADVAPEPPLLGRPVNLVAVVTTRAVDADGVVRATPVVGTTVELAGFGRWVLRSDSSTTSTTDGFGSTSTTVSGGDAVARTDSAGRVRYELRCQAPGRAGLYLRVPVRVQPTPTPSAPAGEGETSSTTTTTAGPRTTIEAVDLELPECVDPTTLTTTTTAGTGSSSTTSTTGR